MTSQENTINQLDPELADFLKTTLDTGEGIRLPFAAPVIWAVNGTAALKALGGAQYYGGWAVKDEDLEDAAQEWSVDMPANFTQAEISPRNGDTYSAYTARSIAVAPICLRQSWILDGHRFVDYQDGSRRHVQILCMMAVKVDKKYAKWGPVVLSAKGFQARNITDAFKAWEKHTAPMRRKVASLIPPAAFWVVMGTFGDEREFINVGKPGAQSPITPIKAWLSKEVTAEMLAGWFIGNDTAREMKDLREQADEWAQAWREPAQVQQPDGFGDDYRPEFEEEIAF